MISNHQIHEYNIPAVEDKLLDVESFLSSYLSDIQKVYKSLLAQLAGSINLSGFVSCGDAIYTYSTSLLKIGMILGTLFGKDYNLDPRSVLKRTNQKDFQTQLVKEGVLTFKKDINQLSNLHLVNLKTDTGTVLFQHFVHSTISNPYLLMNSVVMNVFESVYDGEQYFQYFKDMIDEIRNKFNLEVIAVIHDNLISQASAVKRLIRVKGYTKILDIPCFNHMLNLVFLNSMQISTEMSSLVTKILEFCVVLRKKESINIIGRRAHTVSKTRWFYIIELIDFIVKHKDSILTLNALNGEQPYSSIYIFALN